MSEWRDAYKPAAPARLHLLLAASMWTVVGVLLLFFGVRWTLAEHVAYIPLWLALATAAGLLKARFVLRPSARRAVARIRERGDRRCIGGFLSWRSWMLVALMAVGGRVLRQGLLPHAVVGLIYVLVGIALVVGGTPLWKAWHKWDAA